MPPPAARLLIADGDVAVRATLAPALAEEGFEVRCVEDGNVALALARDEPFDVVVLELVLPGRPGTEVVRTLRAESAVPIMVVTSRDAEADRVLGLELGADDYVTKPFSVREVVSRVRALLRRRQLDREDTTARVREVDGIRVDLLRHEVLVDSRPVRLTRFEFKTLALLAEEPGRVFTRREIMQHLWDTPYGAGNHACDVHISNLRRKIERYPDHPQRIVTVRGVGYRLTAP